METTARAEYYVSGLACGGGGAATLERVLSRVTGVAEVVVNPATHIAYIRFDARICEPPLLVEAASKAGFGIVPL